MTRPTLTETERIELREMIRELEYAQMNTSNRLSEAQQRRGERLALLRKLLAIASASAVDYQRSAVSEARQLVDDCTKGDGSLDRNSLLSAIARVFVALYGAQGRLPKFRDIVTGRVSE